MDCRDFDFLTRALTSSGARRDALTAAFGGALGLLARAEIAGGHRKGKRNKKRCKHPYCHGKDCSIDTRCERPGSAVNCFCRHDPKTGEPRCVQGGTIVNVCADCDASELCVSCTGQLTCNLPCPNPR